MAKADSELVAEVDPADLARYLFTLIEGLAAQLRDGAILEELRRLVKIVMKAWPT